MISETIIDVRYPDCDPMGIVHHAVYPIWYEAARMDFFKKMGFSYSGHYWQVIITFILVFLTATVITYGITKIKGKSAI